MSNLRKIFYLHAGLTRAWAKGMRMILTPSSRPVTPLQSPVLEVSHRELGCYAQRMERAR